MCSNYSRFLIELLASTTGRSIFELLWEASDGRNKVLLIYSMEFQELRAATKQNLDALRLNPYSWTLIWEFPAFRKLDYDEQVFDFICCWDDVYDKIIPYLEGL
jgi:hypothetical protein